MRSMKRRERKPTGAPPAPADLLVCFPSRAHLTLLPKPICSPARTTSDSNRRHHFLKKYAAKTKTSDGGEITSEPTSPKVTCAGQIKIKPKNTRPHSGKTWQSVMEEIERNHNHRRNQKKKPILGEPLSFKREIFNFLSCLRHIKFDFRCLRGFPSNSDVPTDDESEEEEEEENSKTMFSKWFMVLQEEEERKCRKVPSFVEESIAPPSNALLLMRCKSAPSKSWLKKEEQEQEQEEEEEKKKKISLKLLMEEEEMMKKKKENLMVMNYYDTDFYKLSSDIAKETWVVSGSSNKDKDPLVRSRSWKR